MAITTVETVDIMYNNVAVNSYGLSDTLDNYTIDDILNYVYCSASHRGLYGFYGYAENANIMDYNSILPFSVIKGNSGRIILDVPRGSTLPMPQGAYEYIVWLKKVSGTIDQILTVDNIDKYKMITEMPSNKMLYELPNPAGTKDNIKSWTSGNGTECYATGASYGSLSYIHTVGGEDNLIGISDTHPYMLIKHEDTVFFWRINMEPMRFLCRPFGHGVYGVMYVGGKAHKAFDNVNYSAVGNNMLTLGDPNVLPYEWGTGTGSSTSGNPNKWGTCEGSNIVHAVGGGNQADVFGTFRLEFSINTKDQALLFWAACGVYFKAGDKTYKPIIEGGYVSGYTDDLNKPSDLDDWDGKTKHTVPAGPPGGGGGGDDDDPSDDQLSGGIYGGASGMCNLYYMTSAEIKNLQDWFRGSTFSPGIQIPANFDPSTQLIGLMAFPIELGGSITSDTITFRTSDNQAVNTGVSCQKAYGDDLKFDMGTIDIPARMQERGVPFLDYSSQIEVYIPFCDVVQLDVQQVIGTTLKCEMWISPATGDVSAMLSSGTHPVAYTSGSCAQQLPISVGSYGAIAGARLAADNRKSQAVYQAAQNIIKDITNAGAITSAVSNHTAVNGQGMVEFSRIPQVQSNTGLAMGAGIKAVGTIVNTALNLTAQNLDNKYALQVAKNSAPTHVSGSFGACTSWHFPNYCYVKITRPHFKKPDNYGHTEAVPVVATKQLSELSGLTTCVNPDVSGIGTATMQELETIKGYLMSGVIL